MRDELHANKVNSQREISQLKAQLSETKELLDSTDYLANAFEKVERYTKMQNNVMEQGLTWWCKKSSRQYLGQSYTFLHDAYIRRRENMIFLLHLMILKGVKGLMIVIVTRR